ncbi:MAG: chemotaxis protein CheB [Bryobacterales bacterium]|nr:chemotaxis protein CheB [Bryobacterales bacterium]
MGNEPARDIVVAGASAGGVAALRQLVSGLPAGLGAAVFVVLHLPAESESYLADILSRSGPLPAIQAAGRAPVETGRIYIAPPDRHLMFRDGELRVIRGPKENRHRPSIDVLFRSAAKVYGKRVAGVLLSGADDDGTAGLEAIQRQGGVTIVQDPLESAHPEMPQSALAAMEPDFRLRASEIGPLIGRLAGGEAQPAGRFAMPESNQEPALPGKAVGGENIPGSPTAFSCPDCNGTLWELQEGDLVRYRCRVGHAYSAGSLLEAESEAVERALWEAVRVLEESVAMSRRVALKSEILREPLTRKAEERAAHAEVIRKLLSGGEPD